MPFTIQLQINCNNIFLFTRFLRDETIIHSRLNWLDDASVSRLLFSYFLLLGFGDTAINHIIVDEVVDDVLSDPVIPLPPRSLALKGFLVERVIVEFALDSVSNKTINAFVVDLSEGRFDDHVEEVSLC